MCILFIALVRLVMFNGTKKIVKGERKGPHHKGRTTAL